MMKPTRKPPLGIKPRFIHDKERYVELRDCIWRQLNEGFPILPEWIEEYNELVQRFGDEN